MGNICSKSANKDDSFSTPGRVLGSSAAQPQAQGRASIPAAAKPKPVSEPPRQLGTGGDASSDPRSAAARAAEERANAANKPGGKLAGQLAAQKKQTQNQTLNAQSERERMARTADENAQNRNWN